MYINRFWSSVWSVLAYLFGIGLLEYIMRSVVTLFGLLRGPEAMLLTTLVSVAVPIAGTLLYMDWSWGWTPEHIGLHRRSSSVLWLLAGLGAGGLAGFLAYLTAWLLNRLGLPAGAGDPAVSPLVLLLMLLRAPAVEIVFRGAVPSRFQADLSPREALLAAPLAPFAWYVLGGALGVAMPNPGLAFTWSIPMSVFLSLLFLRTDSVWLSVGIHTGMMGSALAFRSPGFHTGALVVWTLAALVMLALEWYWQQRTPRRVPPRRTQRVWVWNGRNPWGPH
jgi:membrane protease YdiL (CAAX protease family)